MAFFIDPASGHKSMFQRRLSPQGTRQQTLDQLMSSISRGQASAQVANIKRRDQITSILDDLISRAGPGGAFQRSGEAKIKTAQTRGVGQELSRLVGSGLAGTTEFGAVGRKWEAEVGAPARLTLESLMEEKQTAAKLQKAQFIERIEDVGPNANLLANLMSRV